MNFRNYLYSKNSSSEINEEFKTDEQGIKQLQAKQDTLNDKLRPIYKQIKELENKRSTLMYKMAGVSTNLLEFSEKGEKHPEMEASFKKMSDEYDKIERELKKLYPRYDELSDEIDRNQKVLAKMIVRNGKELGMDILLYVSKNDLHHKSR